MAYKKYVMKEGDKYVKGFGDKGVLKLTDNHFEAQGFNDTYKGVTHVLIYELINEAKL